MTTNRAHTWGRRIGGLALACVFARLRRHGGATPGLPGQGEIRLDGQPTEGAFLVFHPVAGAAAEPAKGTGEPVRPTAQVKSDGSFQLTTYAAQDGARPAIMP
jgi:hypothetical protein